MRPEEGRKIWSIDRPIHIRDSDGEIEWGGRIVVGLYRERGAYRCLVNVLDSAYRTIESVEFDDWSYQVLLARVRDLVRHGGQMARWELIRQAIEKRIQGGIDE